MQKQAFVLLKQRDHGTYQAQVPVPAPLRVHAAQQRHRNGEKKHVSAFQQVQGKRVSY